MKLIKEQLYNDNGIIINESYFTIDGIAHNDNGPASINYNVGGYIENEEYWIDGKLHREDAAATLFYDKNGDITHLYYYKNGLWHREDGPAIIDCANGFVSEENYCINGNFHREDGPAVIEYDLYGNILVKEYWLNDELIAVYSDAEFEQYKKTLIFS